MLTEIKTIPFVFETHNIYFRQKNNALQFFENLFVAIARQTCY